MARTGATLKSCMITQELSPEFWNVPDVSSSNFTAEQFKTEFSAALTAAQQGNIKPLVNCIVVCLAAANIEISAAYGILHDKDTQTGWDERTQKNVVVQKTSHIHICLQFKEGKGATLEQIAHAAGIEPQYVEKPLRGRYAFDNMLAYLIHIKYTDKYQYQPSDVVTVCPPADYDKLCYNTIYEQRRGEWVKGRGAVARKSAQQNVDWLEEQILSGEVTKSQILLTDELFAIYSRNKKRLDDCFAVYGERKAYKALQAMRNGDFKLSVFYITGKSGAGKTRFAQQFVSYLQEQNSGWQVCSAASSNPVDDYAGEEILLLDDLRGGSMSATDWLKLLDPYNATPSSARYHNKTVAARVIVITSEKNPLEFFYYTRVGGGNRSEALDQFIRRIEALVTVVPYDNNYDNAKVYIAQSTQTAVHDVNIPNSGGATVSMRYGFAAPVCNDVNTAASVLSEIVDKNNYTKQDNCTTNKTTTTNNKE